MSILIGNTKMKEKRISLHIANKDRHSELAMLLQSLRTQTYQAWDLVLLDENQLPIMMCDFLAKLLTRIKMEGHCVHLIRNEIRLGVCHARNLLIEQDYFGNPLVCRLDDDVLLEPDYLSRLVAVIDKGYDIASGVTPLLGMPAPIRNNSKLGKIINEKKVNSKGDIIQYGDDCGVEYLYEGVYPSHEFRSCALMTRTVIKKVKYPKNLSPTGFREEAFFSFKAQSLGFTIGVDVQAKAFHLVTPSGGVRSNDYADRVRSDDAYFRKWFKEQIWNKQKK